MLQYVTKSKAETRRLGQRLAQGLRAGDVVLLTGPLGAGKSGFARGVALGLKIKTALTSPTFTLLNVYQTDRFPLHHFDWYRINDAEELYAAGLDEYVGGDSLTLIEWHERAPELLPRDCLEVLIQPLDENDRRITFLPRGRFRELDDLGLSDMERDEC